MSRNEGNRARHTIVFFVLVVMALSNTGGCRREVSRVEPIQIELLPGTNAVSFCRIAGNTFSQSQFTAIMGRIHREQPWHPVEIYIPEGVTELRIQKAHDTLSTFKQLEYLAGEAPLYDPNRKTYRWVLPWSR